MSHSVVIVAIPATLATNLAEAHSALDDLLEPFNENTPLDPPVTEWLDQDEVERAVAHYKENPDECTADGEGPKAPFEVFVTEGNIEAWNEWTRQAVGGYHCSDREDGVYDAEEDRFGRLSRYNPNSRWDWWALGGRWNGYFQLKREVSVGSEALPEWRLKTGPVGDDRVEGAQSIPNATGSEDAMLGNAGVFGNAPEANFEAKADLARKSAIDFETARTLAGAQAEITYDAFEEATKGIKVAERWQDVFKRFCFDAGVDPDARPDSNVDGEDVVQAWAAKLSEARDAARAFYSQQPWIKALSAADLNSWFGEPVDDWCVHDGGRETFVKNAVDRTDVPFAFLVDGTWHEKGQMGWFGMARDEAPQESWNAEFKRRLAALPDDTWLAAVDVHI